MANFYSVTPDQKRQIRRLVELSTLAKSSKFEYDNRPGSESIYFAESPPPPAEPLQLPIDELEVAALTELGMMVCRLEASSYNPRTLRGGILTAKPFDAVETDFKGPHESWIVKVAKAVGTNVALLIVAVLVAAVSGAASAIVTIKVNEREQKNAITPTVHAIPTSKP
jgi:hypothetical protein